MEEKTDLPNAQKSEPGPSAAPKQHSASGAAAPSATEPSAAGPSDTKHGPDAELAEATFSQIDAAIGLNEMDPQELVGLLKKRKDKLPSPTFAQLVSKAIDRADCFEQKYLYPILEEFGSDGDANRIAKQWTIEFLAKIEPFASRVNFDKIHDELRGQDRTAGQ
jgi:hypothetical protein